MSSSRLRLGRSHPVSQLVHPAAVAKIPLHLAAAAAAAAVVLVQRAVQRAAVQRAGEFAHVCKTGPATDVAGPRAISLSASRPGSMQGGCDCELGLVIMLLLI